MQTCRAYPAGAAAGMLKLELYRILGTAITETRKIAETPEDMPQENLQPQTTDE
jgi:hypothetical protein